MDMTSKPSPEPDLQEKTILIIDDNPANLGVLAKYLEESGFEVLVARNGKTGFEKARFVHPDLILLDIVMPGIDGFETCRRLKATENTKDIPVMFMTALTETEHKIKGFQVGAVDYITKPFQKEEVLVRVTTHLRLRELTEQLEQKVQERTRELTIANQRLKQEIAEHKQAEVALRESDERYTALFERSLDLVYIHDFAGNFIDANSAALNLLGYSKEEILSLNFASVLSPDQIPLALETAEKLKKTGVQVGTTEYKLLCKDGTYVYVETKGAVIYRNGQPFAIQGIARDITGHKRAEEALRESEERYRTFITHSSEGIYRIDVVPPVPIDLPPAEIVKYINEHAIVAEVNDALADMYGLTTEEMIGKPATDFAPDYGVRAELVLQNTDYQVTHEETLDVDKDGIPLYLEESYHGEIYDGHLVRIWGVQRNITERKQAEEKIRKLNAELEERVKQRTAELEAANKELKDFAYVVSHDLKAPLRGISRLAQWLVADYTDAFNKQGKEMIDLLVGRVKRMDSLIDGILHYSRVGRLIGRDEQIDLNTLVKDVIDMLAPLEHIHISFENELPVIIGDKIRIAEVFQNLLSNAIEFMDKSDGKITIGCVDRGSYWKFSIADNGPGIDKRYYEKIFQVFQTLAPRDKHESTGIGLALVKKIVELYGGKIWVESTAGEGSVFFFTLPKKEEK
jgi:two-component system sensor kinase FixL